MRKKPIGLHLVFLFFIILTLNGCTFTNTECDNKQAIMLENERLEIGIELLQYQNENLISMIANRNDAADANTVAVKEMLITAEITNYENLQIRRMVLIEESGIVTHSIIQYPEIWAARGIDNQDLIENINNIVREIALSKYQSLLDSFDDLIMYSTEMNAFSFQQSYRIELINSEIISISFHGIHFISGHPNPFKFAITIDLQTGLMLELADFITIQEIESKIFTGYFNLKDTVLSIADIDLIVSHINFTDERNLSSFYLINVNNVCIIASVPRHAGSNATICVMMR